MILQQQRLQRTPRAGMAISQRMRMKRKLTFNQLSTSLLSPYVHPANRTPVPSASSQSSNPSRSTASSPPKGPSWSATNGQAVRAQMPSIMRTRKALIVRYQRSFHAAHKEHDTFTAQRTVIVGNRVDNALSTLDSLADSDRESQLFSLMTMQQQ